MSERVERVAACGVTFSHDWHGYRADDGRTRVCDGEPLPLPGVHSRDPETPMKSAEVHSRPIPPAERLTNACACGDCYHPAFGPDTDGEPCEWCRDCGCHGDKHTRMTRVLPPGESSCLCRDPLREVHAGCSLHGHSLESVFPPGRGDR